MKKFLCSMLIAVMAFSLAACSSAKLADGFNKDDVTAKAKTVVETVNASDYDAVVSMLREDLQGSLSADDLKSAWGEQLSDAGTFKEYKTVAVYGQKDKDTDEDYAVCVLVCTYENSTLTYTLSFDKDLELVGLYMK